MPYIAADTVEYIILRKPDKDIAAMRTDGVQMYPVGRHQKKITRLVGMPFTLAPHRVCAEVAASFQDICHLKEQMPVFPYRKLIVLSQENLLVLFAQFCYAFYIVRFKDFVNKYSLITIMKWMFTYSFICTIPFSASDLMNADWGGLKAVEIGSLTFIVVGATFVSYMLIVVGQKNLRPTVAGMYNYIQPLVACIVAVCWGMDSFNTTKIIAVVLIFGGVYLVTSSRSRKEMEAYKQAQAERE